MPFKKLATAPVLSLGADGARPVCADVAAEALLDTI